MHGHRLPLTEHVWLEVPGLLDHGGILHVSFPIPNFTGVSGHGDSPFQCHNGQMSHKSHGGNHPSGKGLGAQICGPPSLIRKRVTVRSTSFLNYWLFDGHPKQVASWLEASAQDLSVQKSIKAKAASTQQLSKSFTPFTQQKPPFQGAGNSQVPKGKKKAPKGVKPFKARGHTPTIPPATGLPA